MTRVCFDSAPPWHTIDAAHPGGTIRLDCGDEVSYRHVHVTTADVPPTMRCQQCENRRLDALEYFANRRVDDAMRSWEVD